MVGTDAWLAWLPRIIDGLSDGLHPRYYLPYYEYSGAFGHALPRIPAMKAKLEELLMNYHQQTERARLAVQTAEQVVAEANAKLARQLATETALIRYLAGFPPDEPPPPE